MPGTFTLCPVEGSAGVYKGLWVPGPICGCLCEWGGGLGSSRRVRGHSLPLSAVSPLPTSPSHSFLHPSLFLLPVFSPGSSSSPRLLEELGRWLPAASSVQSELSVVTAGLPAVGHPPRPELRPWQNPAQQSGMPRDCGAARAVSFRLIPAGPSVGLL